MSSVQTRPRQMTFTGLPLSSWNFALRIWLAMMIALYIAFWLQLAGAASAMTCVGILAIPARGNFYEKAAYRFFGTVIGVIVSIVMAGLFGQLRDLFIVAVAAWTAICVFGAGLFDGNKAYAFVLSGYTVAVVAVGSIDAPQSVFSAGVNRGAAIAVGIVVLACINDLFAPDVYPEVLKKLKAAHQKTREFAIAALDFKQKASATDTAKLLTEITGIRSNITALSTESPQGRYHSAAARSVAAALVSEILAARAVAVAIPSMRAAGDTVIPNLKASLGGEQNPSLFQAGGVETSKADDTEQVLLNHLAETLLNDDRLAIRGLQNLAASRKPEFDARLPIYKSAKAAAWDGLRVFIASVIAGFIFILLGWTAASLSLTVFISIAALSLTTPDPRGLAMGALVALPVAILAAGITEFFILSSADEFPLLALATAPTIIGSCLMMASSNPKLNGMGSFVLIFYTVALSLSNPQATSPEPFLFSAVLLPLAVAMVYIAFSVLLVTTAEDRKRWYLQSAESDLRDVTEVGSPVPSKWDVAYKEADRIRQLARLEYDSPEAKERELRRALDLSNLTVAAAETRLALDQTAEIFGHDQAAASGAKAVAMLDPNLLSQASQRLQQSQRSDDAKSASLDAAGGLALLAFMTGTKPDHDKSQRERTC